MRYKIYTYTSTRDAAGKKKIFNLDKLIFIIYEWSCAMQP